MEESPDNQTSKDNLETKEAGTEQAVKEKPAGKGKEGKEKKNKDDEKQRTSANMPIGGLASKPTARFAPTYRLEPKNPLKKERLEIIIKAEMDKNYHEEYTFHPKYSLHMAAQVSEDIKTRIKALNFDRYRYIVLITVGEYLMQGLYSMANFLWDAERDGYVSYTIETPKFFAVCSVFYIYFD